MKYLFILTSTWHYPRTALGGGGDRVWWLTVAAPCVTGEVGASVVCGLGGVWVVYGGGELVVPLVEVVNGGGVLYLLRNIFAKLGNMASKKHWFIPKTESATRLVRTVKKWQAFINSTFSRSKFSLVDFMTFKVAGFHARASRVPNIVRFPDKSTFPEETPCRWVCQQESPQCYHKNHLE